MDQSVDTTAVHPHGANSFAQAPLADTQHFRGKYGVHGLAVLTCLRHGIVPLSPVM